MKKQSAFQLRAMVSVLLALAFAALLLSGLILFVSPPGRVANWTDWRLLGLTKSTWGGLHIWFGFLFASTTVAHLAYNWRPLVSYFKARRQRPSRVRPEWIASAATATVVFVGTSLAVPPFVSLLEWNETIKESWEATADSAPVPHAELLTVAELAGHANLSPEQAVDRLRAAGLTEATAANIVGELAAAHDRSAQALFALLAPAPATATGADPETPGAGGGLGWKTLADYCAAEGVPLELALERLKAAGLTARPDQILRDIARENGLSRPHELIAAIQGETR